MNMYQLLKVLAVLLLLLLLAGWAHVRRAGGASAQITGETLAGNTTVALQQQGQVGNLIVVAKERGDFASIGAALNSIQDASADNRYLVYVAPGVYHERVSMKPYVDVEGAGQLSTWIVYPGTITVIGAHHAELSHVSVENTSDVSFAIALYSNHGVPRFTQVRAIAGQGDINIPI